LDNHVGFFSIQPYRATDPFDSSVIAPKLTGDGADKSDRLGMIWLCRQNLPIALLGLGKSSRPVAIKPQRQNARGRRSDCWKAQPGAGAALTAIHDQVLHAAQCSNAIP
jgi:hypothetical protein